MDGQYWWLLKSRDGAVRWVKGDQSGPPLPSAVPRTPFVHALATPGGNTVIVRGRGDEWTLAIQSRERF